jgi:hypothetical protein
VDRGGPNLSMADSLAVPTASTGDVVDRAA